jgi:hypothetical protein
VIGFAKNPKECNMVLLRYFTNQGIIQGAAFQELGYGDTSDEVCASTPQGLNWVWLGWTDGVQSLCRSDVATADADFFAEWAYAEYLYFFIGQYSWAGQNTGWLTGLVSSGSTPSCDEIADVTQAYTGNYGYHPAASSRMHNLYQGIRCSKAPNVQSTNPLYLPFGFDIDTNDGRVWHLNGGVEYSTPVSSEPMITLESGNLHGAIVFSSESSQVNYELTDITDNGNGYGSGTIRSCITSNIGQFTNSPNFDNLPAQIKLINHTTTETRTYKNIGWHHYNGNLWCVRFIRIL